MYFLGNLIESLTSSESKIADIHVRSFSDFIHVLITPNLLTPDPPAIWMIGTILSLALLWVSFSRLRKYSPVLSTAVIYFSNFNIVLGYVESILSATGDAKSMAYNEATYLFICYAIFIVSSQLLDSRRELITITFFEVIFFIGAVIELRGHQHLLLQPLQTLVFFFVLIGNFFMGTMRLRLTQISGGSSIQFKAISESARDIQSIINRKFEFLYINPSVRELTGYSSVELTGKDFTTLVADEDREPVVKALENINQIPGQKQSIEYRIKVKSGEQVWVESIFSGFKQGNDEDAKTELIFAETRDIEVRKQLENEIKKQLQVEGMLIKYSNQFINVERTEIQRSIDTALGEFGRMLEAEAVFVYRMHGKLQDEFRSTNQWFSERGAPLGGHFNLVVKINQELLLFLRSLRGDKSSHGNFFDAKKLFDVQALDTSDIHGKRFYLVPLQSGNIVNGFVVFVFDETVTDYQSSFFGLIGNMVSSAFTRLRTEMRLHEAQLTNESILRALPDWLYIINKGGEFTGTNNYSTLPDYIPDYGLIGKTIGDVLPKEMAQLFSHALEEVVDTDIASSFEYHDTAIYKDRHFKAIIAPFKANEYLIIIRDITDLKSAQDELLTKAKKLEQSNKELEEFAYVVSHDMKQPIRTIISYLSLLKRKHLESLSAEAQEFINFSIDGANKMSDLIRDILQYSRLDQQISLVSDISLNGIVSKVRKGLNDTITANNAEVISDELPTITGNETMLTELFQNLIENGIKYNLNEKKIIRINVLDNGTDWLFNISDNGIGFEQQYAQQIFKIFKRLHTDNEFQGTGIGLAVCQKVVEKHGGKIWAESKKGFGSTFHFTLPKR